MDVRVRPFLASAIIVACTPPYGRAFNVEFETKITKSAGKVAGLREGTRR